MIHLVSLLHYRFVHSLEKVLIVSNDPVLSTVRHTILKRLNDWSTLPKYNYLNQSCLTFRYCLHVIIHSNQESSPYRTYRKDILQPVMSHHQLLRVTLVNAIRS